MDQTVYVSANLWPKRSSPADCSKNPGKHLLTAEGNMGAKTGGILFRNGVVQLKPLHVKAGETVTVNVEMDLRNHYNRDWSVVAWAYKQ